MDSLPIEYLHLETFVFPIFLALLTLVQLARSAEPGYVIVDRSVRMMWLLTGFVGAAIVFGGLLYNVSPLLAVELAAGVTLALLHPVNALCLFVHLLFLRPWEIAPTNPLLLALPRGLAALCLFSWLIHPTQHAKPNPRTTRGLGLLLVFSLWLFISTFFTPNISETQMDWFNTYFRALIIFIMSVFFIDSERSLTQFTLTLVLSALALMVVRYYQYHTEGPTLIRLETGGMFGDPNDLAAVIVMAIPFSLVPILRWSVGIGQQVMGVLFAAFSMLLIWYSQSRGAMLALGVQMLTAGFLSLQKNKWLVRLILIGVLGAAYGLTLKGIARDSSEMQESSDSRIMYWKAAINMTLHHPVFGVGFNHYPDTYNEYSSGERYEYGRRTAHSSWFLVFAESGVPGGLLFVSFFILVLRTAWRNRQRWPDQLYALVGYGVVMTFLSHTYIFYFYLLAGLVMASDSFGGAADHVA